MSRTVSHLIFQTQFSVCWVWGPTRLHDWGEGQPLLWEGFPNTDVEHSHLPALIPKNIQGPVRAPSPRAAMLSPPDCVPQEAQNQPGSALWPQCPARGLTHSRGGCTVREGYSPESGPDSG